MKKIQETDKDNPYKNCSNNDKDKTNDLINILIAETI
jgi:hypothetical protein